MHPYFTTPSAPMYSQPQYAYPQQAAEHAFTSQMADARQQQQQQQQMAYQQQQMQQMQPSGPPNQYYTPSGQYAQQYAQGR